LTAYQLRLPTFEGPLDLLLQLIDRRQMDITTVSLAMVTDQYLEHLRSGDGVDPERLSEFVSVAAKLLLIKSAALLPQPERPRLGEPPPDPTDLTARLREYEAIKRAAVALKSREEADLRSFPRVAPAAPPSRNGHPGRSGDGAGGWPSTQLELFPGEEHRNGNGHRPMPADGLLIAFRRATGRRREEPQEVARETWTLADVLSWVLRVGRVAGRASFRLLTFGFGRARLVATFLALLELHRQGQVEVDQSAPYGDIEFAVVPSADRASREAGTGVGV
jgi:segregation and condensation protein A